MANRTTQSVTSAEVVNFTERVPTLEELNAAEIERLIPTVVYLLIICVVGIIGNSLVIHIYRTRYKLSNSQCFILFLSAVDLFSCCVAIPVEVATILEQYTFKHLWLCKLSRCFNTLGTVASSFILLFIAVDRFRKVCKPFGWQIKATVAKVLCVLSIGIGVVVAFPAVFIYGKREFDIPEFNLTGTECSTADEMKGTKFPFIYAAAFGFMFIAGIIAMSILYCFIGHEVRKHAQKMHDLGRNMSIPVTSSIIEPRDSRISTEIAPNMLQKYSVKCNNEIKRKRSSKRKISEDNDDSWTDKRDFELSYTLSQESKEREKTRVGLELRLENGKSDNVDVNKKEYGNSDSEDSGIKVKDETDTIDPKTENNDRKSDATEPKTEASDPQTDTNDFSDHKIDSNEHKNTDDRELNFRKTDTISEQEENDNDGEDFMKTEVSPSSSEEIFTKEGRSLSYSIISLGRRISSAFTRLTSVTSIGTTSGTFKRQTQFLKQARARKTAFLMFMITLAFILSFLPHLLLMLIRQINKNFVVDMSDTERAVYRFFLRSYFMNCAINPVIYSICDSRFKKACKELCNFCCCRTESRDF